MSWTAAKNQRWLELRDRWRRLDELPQREMDELQDLTAEMHRVFMPLAHALRDDSRADLLTVIARHFRLKLVPAPPEKESSS